MSDNFIVYLLIDSKIIIHQEV